MRFRISGLRFQEAFILGFLWFMAQAQAGTNGPSWSPLPSRAEDQPGFQYHPSPDDWRNHTIYQVITDRFYDGDPYNNTANPGGVYNPFSMDTIHGGDFSGLTGQLDYIKALGFDVIWISPVFLNHHGAYHGYHITDFNRIDPHWGTLAELRELTDQAHARNMYVIIDVVFNHMARLLRSDERGFPKFSDTPYPMQWSNPDVKFAPPFDRLDYFHGHGSIQNWEDHRQNVLGDLQGLADLKTEMEDTRNWLFESHMALIAATDCDGFRIDTAHHVELGFWQEVLPRLHEGARALGKTNFLMFAEALRGRDEDVSVLTREGAYPSALYYPYYFTLQEIWKSRGPTRLITERWNNRATYGPHAMNQLVGFADNHDRARLLNADYLNGDTNRLKAVLTQLYASPSIPCVYYGTEQGFNGSKGHHAREPMFHPLTEDIPDRFDIQHDLAIFVARLNSIRKLYPALIHGETHVVMDENKAGLFVFQRMTGDQTVTVLLNNSMESHPYPLDGEWVDAMNGDPYSGTVPADTAIILVSTLDYVSPLTGHAEYRKPEPRNDGLATRSIIFRPDGKLDSGTIAVASNHHLSLHAAFDTETRMLYLATQPAAAHEDRFIMVVFSNHADKAEAPWHKQGTVPGYQILISSEGESDYTSLRGTRDAHWTFSRKDGFFESAFQLSMPEKTSDAVVYIRSETYGTEDRGSRLEDYSLPTADSTNRYVIVELKSLIRQP